MKDRPVHRKNFDSEAISMEAASWILQLDNDSLGKADMDALREWVGRSPAHALAVREYASAWMSIDDVLLKATEAENIAREDPRWPTLFMMFAKSSFRLWIPVAAVVMVFFAAAILYLLPSGSKFETTAITYSTRLGEQAQFKMADGSMIHLNTGSVVAVEYRPSRRIVRLLKGEAHFEVAHDSARPFDVIANGKRVTAVGTAFDVRLTDMGLNVMVTEGSVVVARILPVTASGSDRQEGKAKILAILEPNEKMVVESGEVTIEKIKKQAIERQLAWREGMLVFDDDPLSYVIAEVSRYTKVKIILANRKLGDLRVGGLFKAGETQALLNALEVSFDLHAVRVDKKTIRLSMSANSRKGS